MFPPNLLILISRTAVAAMTAAFCSTAIGAEDCSKALVPDISIIKNDIASRTAFLSIINKESYESKKTDAGLSAEFSILEIPFGVGIDYEKFSEGRSKYFEKVQYSTSYKNASNFLLRTLPPSAFQAYSNCLQLQAQLNDGPHIIPLAVSDSLLTFKLIWRSPPGASTGKPIFNHSGFEKISVSKLPKNMPSNSDVDIILSRTPNQEARIAVSIGGKSDSLVIPLAPSVVTPPPVKGPKEIYLSPPYTTEGDGRRTKNLSCPDGYHVIPGSAKCTSTSQEQSGNLTDNQAIGKTSWFCRWEKYSPIGVGLKIEMACERD